MHSKGPSCLKLVRKFFMSIQFEPGGFMKILYEIKIQGQLLLK